MPHRKTKRNDTRKREKALAYDNAVCTDPKKIYSMLPLLWTKTSDEMPRLSPA
jgi:hypothetical protein